MATIKLTGLSAGRVKGISTEDTAQIDGHLDLGDANTDTITVNAEFDSDLVPDVNNSFDLGDPSKAWANVYGMNLWGESLNAPSSPLSIKTNDLTRVSISDNSALFDFTETITKKTLQGTSSTTAVLQDTTFSGIGTSNFTVSCWFYQNDTNSDPISTNTKIMFLQSTTERHVLDLRFPDVAIQYENTASGLDNADFDTNLEEGNWYHIVAHFDVSNLSTGVPRLWVNGVEISSTGYTSIGGTTPSIDNVRIYLDDGTAMHDVVFWNSLLSESAISELYNRGLYFDPSTHSASAGIISWFKLGEESALSSFNNGDTLSGTINLNDEIGSNSFTLTNESEFSILNRTLQSGSTTSAIDCESTSLRIRQSFTPISASDFGQKGEIAWDDSYLYVCVATDTWKRVALASW